MERKRMTVWTCGHCGRGYSLLQEADRHEANCPLGRMMEPEVVAVDKPAGLRLWDACAGVVFGGLGIVAVVAAVAYLARGCA